MEGLITFCSKEGISWLRESTKIVPLFWRQCGIALHGFSLLLGLFVPIDGALLICRQIARVDRDLFLCRMILNEAHMLQRFVLWLRIADLTRSPASTGTGMVVDRSFDILRVEHYLTFPAMEHLGIRTV